VVQKFKYCYMVLRSLNLPVIVICFIFVYLRWCLRSTRFLSGSCLRAESKKNFSDQKRSPFSVCRFLLNSYDHITYIIYICMLSKDNVGLYIFKHSKLICLKIGKKYYTFIRYNINLSTIV